jgi:flagellar biosynthesis regulator FlaF
MKPTPKYSTRPTSDDPRDVEAWALGEAARRLADASREPDNLDALRAALQLNQRLWTIFQAAMTEDDCPLPKDLRTNIAALSLLVDRETMARLVDLDATKLELLININRNIAGGLMDGRAAQARNEAAAAPAPVPPPVPASATTARPADPAPPKTGGFRISI